MKSCHAMHGVQMECVMPLTPSSVPGTPRVSLLYIQPVQPVRACLLQKHSFGFAFALWLKWLRLPAGEHFDVQWLLVINSNHDQCFLSAGGSASSSSSSDPPEGPQRAQAPVSMVRLLALSAFLRGSVESRAASWGRRVLLMFLLKGKLLKVIV